MNYRYYGSHYNCKNIVFSLEQYTIPKPLYQSSALLDYIEASIDALITAFPTATVILTVAVWNAGDFNGLDDADVTSRSALNSIVNRPARGANCLDRIYVNDSHYAVKVVISTVRSEHKSSHRLLRSAAAAAEQEPIPAAIQALITIKTCSLPSTRFKPYIRLF